MHVDPPEVTIYGPTEVDFGSIVSIGCTVLKGNPTPSVFIITPQERIINESMITFNATIKDAGVYTCVANNSEATVTRNLSLTVYGMHVLLITKICSHNNNVSHAIHKFILSSYVATYGCIYVC